MVAAGAAYRLPGARGRGVTEMPALDRPAAGGLAYHHHSGGRTVLPADWKIFFAFSGRHYQTAAKRRPGSGPSH